MTSCVHDHSEWTSRWGAGDQAGAGNWLTPERTLQSLQMVERGQVFDLSHVIRNGAPRIEPNQTPYVMTIGPRADNVIRRRRTSGATNDAGTTLERVEMTTHVGTHIDALGHASIGERLYNGFALDDALDDFGLTDDAAGDLSLQLPSRRCQILEQANVRVRPLLPPASPDCHLVASGAVPPPGGLTRVREARSIPVRPSRTRPCGYFHKRV